MGDPSDPDAAASGPTPDVYKELARDRLRAALFGLETPRPQIRYGRYRVEGSLGEGGMGTVVLARDEALDREVAIKLLHPQQGEDQRRRLRREAQALARLSHPNVVQVFEVGEHEGQMFIAMERVQGQTLDVWHGSARPWRKCLEIYLQAGRGLAAAHAVELIHRDFKPHNCIVDEDGRVRVLDFGLARKTETAPSTLPERPKAPRELDDALGDSLTRTGATVGTLAYMAPEQWEGRTVSPRSDQFAFCVSLYQGLCGARPFAGKSIHALMLAVQEGRLEPPPSPVDVPSSVLTIVRRGLAPEPEDRWPTMDALLEALEAQLRPPRRWGRWAALTAVAGMGVVMLFPESEPSARCEDAGALIEPTWGDARAQEIETAFENSGVAFAAPTWPRVRQHLDAYAERWAAVHQGACEARLARPPRPAAMFDRQMRCLAQRRTALEETLTVLAGADGRVVQEAVSLVEGLPGLARCEDLDALEQDVPPPEEPERAAEVERLRRRLTEAQTQLRVGRIEGVEATVEGVVEQSAALGYAPLHAEALLIHGQLLRDRGKPEPALEASEEAYMLARAKGHDGVAAEAAIVATQILGRQLARFDDAERWGRLAEGLVASRSPRPRSEAKRVLGLVYTEQGRFTDARDAYEEGLAILDTAAEPHSVQRINLLSGLADVLRILEDFDRAQRINERNLTATEASLGPLHPRVAKLLVSQGNGLHEQGDYEGARKAHERALELLETILGERHPAIATTLNNLGNALERLGHEEQALEHHRRAQRIREEALGPEHPQVAESLLGQGIALGGMKRYEEAAAVLSRALPTLEDAYGQDHYVVGLVLTQLGLAEGHLGDPESGERRLRRALALIQASKGERHSETAHILTNLALLLREQGDVEQARSALTNALDVATEALGPEHPTVALILLEQVRLGLHEHRPEAVREVAERALHIAETADTEPGTLADVRMGMVRVLEESDPVRARALAEQANDEYGAKGGAAPNPAREWLDAHPP